MPVFFTSIHLEFQEGGVIKIGAKFYERKAANIYRKTP